MKNTVINLRARKEELDYQIKQAEQATGKSSTCSQALICQSKVVTLQRDRRVVNKKLIEAECEVKKLNRIYKKGKK